MAGKTIVKVGILSDQWRSSKGYHDEIGPIELASIHEFGSQKRKIPERSFLRKTMATREKDFKSWVSEGRDVIAKMIKEAKTDEILKKIGAKWVSYVVQTFRDQGPGWAPLSPKTLAMRRAAPTGKWIWMGNRRVKEKKPSNRILWVTGALVNSIVFKVKERGK